MARTILEDYLEGDRSHFDLAYAVPRRAREIQRRPGLSLVPEGQDKPIVVALREILERYEKR